MSPDEQPQQNNHQQNRLKSPKAMIVGLLILVIAIVVVVLALNHNKTTTTNTSQSPNRQATVNVTKSGFVPATLHVTSGTTIVWQNTSTSPRHVASDPYPADSSVPGLDSKTMLPKSSYSYQATSPQTIHYHDDTAPTHNGTIVIE